MLILAHSPTTLKANSKVSDFALTFLQTKCHTFFCHFHPKIGSVSTRIVKKKKNCNELLIFIFTAAGCSAISLRKMFQYAEFCFNVIGMNGFGPGSRIILVF